MTTGSVTSSSSSSSSSPLAGSLAVGVAPPSTAQLMFSESSVAKIKYSITPYFNAYGDNVEMFSRTVCWQIRRGVYSTEIMPKVLRQVSCNVDDTVRALLTLPAVDVSHKQIITCIECLIEEGSLAHLNKALSLIETHRGLIAVEGHPLFRDMRIERLYLDLFIALDKVMDGRAAREVILKAFAGYKIPQEFTDFLSIVAPKDEVEKREVFRKAATYPGDARLSLCEKCVSFLCQKKRGLEAVELVSAVGPPVETPVQLLSGKGALPKVYTDIYAILARVASSDVDQALVLINRLGETHKSFFIRELLINGNEVVLFNMAKKNPSYVREGLIRWQYCAYPNGEQTTVNVVNECFPSESRAIFDEAIKAYASFKAEALKTHSPSLNSLSTSSSASSSSSSSSSSH